MARQMRIGKARRRWLLGTVASLGTAALPGAVRHVLAMGERPAAPGLYRVEGDVRVNGRPAAAGLAFFPQTRYSPVDKKAVPASAGSSLRIVRRLCYACESRRRFACTHARCSFDPARREVAAIDQQGRRSP